MNLPGPGEIQERMNEFPERYGFGVAVSPLTICGECTMPPAEIRTAKAMCWLESPPGNGTPIVVFIPEQRHHYDSTAKEQMNVLGRVFRVAACSRCRRLHFIQE